MQALTDKLWAIIAPHLSAPLPERTPARFHYRLRPGTPLLVYQAEALFVALETAEHTDAFVALLSAERWGALVPSSGIDLEQRATVLAAQLQAGDRIARVLIDHRAGVSLRLAPAT